MAWRSRLVSLGRLLLAMAALAPNARSEEQEPEKRPAEEVQDNSFLIEAAPIGLTSDSAEYGVILYASFEHFFFRPRTKTAGK